MLRPDASHRLARAKPHKPARLSIARHGENVVSRPLELASRRPDLRDLQAWIVGHLTEDLGVEILADRMSMNSRNFARMFLSETGMTPAKFVEMARIDAARQHLVSSELPIGVVADKSGFRDPEQMRRAFLRQLGVNPHDYRVRFSSHHERPVHPVFSTPCLAATNIGTRSAGSPMPPS